MNITQKINSRKFCISWFFSNIFEQVSVSDLLNHFPLDVDRELIDQLVDIYTSNEEELNLFVTDYLTNKIVNDMERSVIMCGLCELKAGTDVSLVIKEYLVLSDKFGCNSSLVHAVLDGFVKKYLS